MTEQHLKRQQQRLAYWGDSYLQSTTAREGYTAGRIRPEEDEGNG